MSDTVDSVYWAYVHKARRYRNYSIVLHMADILASIAIILIGFTIALISVYASLSKISIALGLSVSVIKALMALLQFETRATNLRNTASKIFRLSEKVARLSNRALPEEQLAAKIAYYKAHLDAFDYSRTRNRKLGSNSLGSGNRKLKDKEGGKNNGKNEKKEKEVKSLPNLNQVGQNQIEHMDFPDVVNDV